MPEGENTHLDTELTKWLRCQQSTDLRDNWAVETANNNLVAFVQDAIRQHDINGRTKTLNNLDLKHSTLKFRQVHKAVTHALLGQVDEKHDHVRYTFTSDCRRWYERDVAREILVLVVQDCIQTLFCKGKNRLLTPIFEFSLH